MRLNNNHWLLCRPIAHRGLWGEGVIENSLTAYKLASKKGYPIEVDLFLTTDKKLVCFHDDNLKRMTGVDKPIYDCSYEELLSLNLNGSEEKIPSFDQLKEIACGKSPLLIEIKDQPRKEIVDILIESLKDYKGEFAIQSFNPSYINKVRKKAPEFIRGILGTNVCPKEKNFFIRYILKHLSLNKLIKPDFVSYIHSGLPIKSKLPVIAWTVTDKKTVKNLSSVCTNYIFENFIPD